MSERTRRRCIVLVLMAAALAGRSALAAEAPDDALAGRILKTAGVRGGLIVHVGCGRVATAGLTAALGAGEGYLVHGLGADRAHVERARRHVASRGHRGRVSVDLLAGRALPYVDNLVNLLVAEDLSGVAMSEVMRVLCPHGVACIKRGGEWQRTVKPRPAEIDEWTHFLYDASNNAVAADTVVGPPHHLQWVSSPAWARSHDHLASISAVVSSGGRIFYIADEGPVVAVALEPKWSLAARDGFSGVLLWKRPIARWHYHLRGFRSGPSDIARRLVAAPSSGGGKADRVYVTLGEGKPLSALDAATGRTVKTYDGTDGALEVVCDGEALFVVAGENLPKDEAAKGWRRGGGPGFVPARPQRPAYGERPPRKRILAIDPATGRILWKKADADTAELMPTTLAVRGGRAFVQNADEIFCLDSSSGKEIWRAKRPVSRSRPTWSAPTLVAYGDVVLSADRAVKQRAEVDPNDPRKVEWLVTSAGGQAPIGELIAFSAATGQRLWSCACQECYNAPVDVLVADGLVWTGQLVRAKQPGFTQGRDPLTGQVKRTRPKDQTFFAPGMGHGRCHRNRATERYLVLGRSGVEFIDLATGRGIANHWTRGGCQYGVMPCNGLLYAPSHSCACFVTAKLNGFNCLAPAPPKSARPVPPPAPRLQKGPAYSSIGNRQSEIGNRQLEIGNRNWPTYRHDAARTGRAGSPLPARLARAWEADVGRNLSSVVVAEGKLFVAEIDAHTVHALDAADGRRAWRFTAGGRVDSPPTIWRGRALFGCADGSVYCLRAADGKLAWRFRAAPADRRIVAYGQVESAWPVPGSVLVREPASGSAPAVAYCAAGRSSYLHGGIRICRLDARTGRLLGETCIDHRDPNTGHQPKGVTRGTNIPGALPDVLSCDAGSVYLRHLRFDLAGEPQKPDTPHLFSPAGFLDGAWWHRTYWFVGTAMGSNYGGWPRVGSRIPAGRLLALDDATIYGFGRNQYAHHGAHVGIDAETVFHFRRPRDAQRRFTYYRLFAAERQAKPAADAAARRRRQPAPRKQFRWTRKLPILARAMVLAGNTLLLAGPPDILTADDPIGSLAGRRGGTLLAVATADGKDIAQYPLKAPPAWDAMAVAGGRLFLADTAGKVLCFQGK